jgi:hypothetical protein
VKRIQYNTIQACHETHADRELRENLIKERAAGPQYELGRERARRHGSWAVNPQMGAPGGSQEKYTRFHIHSFTLDFTNVFTVRVSFVHVGVS